VKEADRPGAREASCHGRLLGSVLLVCAAIIGAAAGACAPKTFEAPSAEPPRYPDFMFPVVPDGTGGPEAVAALERGWRLLQTGDLGGAEQAFGRTLKASPSFFPAQTALGYAKLAGLAYEAALASFGRALEQSGAYVPALVGRGDALVGAARPREAIESFNRALAVDPSLAEVRHRVEAVRLRLGQEALAAARQATEKRDFDAARRAYQEAIADSPESAFLYRDLAEVERLAGNPGAAVQHLKRAADLDSSDAGTWVQMGVLLEEQNDLAGAAAAYAQAAQLDPGAASSERVDRVRRGLAAVKLPDQFRHIAEAQVTTRGDLAALVGVRLATLVDQAAPGEAVVITDVAGHWAAAWIRAVTRAGIMEVYPNHEFQAGAAVRRADLAQVASRVLQLIGRAQPQRYRDWQRQRPMIADVPPGNVNYAPAALAVAARVMPLVEGGLFLPMRPVSGAEALDVLGRLEVLSR